MYAKNTFIVPQNIWQSIDVAGFRQKSVQQTVGQQLLAFHNQLAVHGIACRELRICLSKNEMITSRLALTVSAVRYGASRYRLSCCQYNILWAGSHMYSTKSIRREVLDDSQMHTCLSLNTYTVDYDIVSMYLRS